LRDQALRAQAGAPDYAAERARFIRARADLAEMEAEEKRRSLIAADEIEAAWIAVLALLRTRLLALPDRLAPQAFDQPTVGDTRNLIRTAIREVLVTKPKEFDPRKYLAPARKAVKELVRHKLRNVLCCAGHAFD
jgi:phage terminase Nu1 subunit (DNA packaging protein)